MNKINNLAGFTDLDALLQLCSADSESGLFGWYSVSMNNGDISSPSKQNG